MLNFNYFNPVNIVFGKETIAELSNLIAKDKKILMLYGGGSIKKNGVYEQVKKALNGYDIVEFSGIESNPTYETCMKAVEIVKNENINFLLAVGGGSVLDGTKFVAAASKLDSDKAWKTIMCGGGFMNVPTLNDALPLASVITLPATGSEMNCGAVISKKSTSEKVAFVSPKVFPQFSIIDPETTFSLPKKQVVNGLVDTFIHTLEQYTTFDVNSPLQDRQAEAILNTLIEQTDEILSETPDYDSRANFFWCATQALNGLIGCGVVQDWATHMIGHELTAFYGIDHAQSLAVVQPQLWRVLREDKGDKLVQYGKRIFGLCVENKDEMIEFTIQKTEEYFYRLGMKTKLSDYGIDAKEAALKISSRFEERGTMLGEKQKITPEVVQEILLKC
jgi:NADP-dependent alcohol dehydrogenase